MWNKKFNECQICGTTTEKYHAKGLCYNCYCRDRYKRDERVRAIKRKATYKWIANNRERFLKKQREYAKKRKRERSAKVSS